MNERRRVDRRAPAILPAARGQVSMCDATELVIRELRQPVQRGCRVRQKISCFMVEWCVLLYRKNCNQIES
jgi:hypothetical protein